MTSVVDRPTTDTRPPARRDIEFPPERQEGRAPQIFRWLGWLLLVGAIAAVAFFVVEATSDEVVETPTVAVNLDPGAITADPKPRTPVTGPVVVEDATVSPLVYSNMRPVQLPDTAFPEESTVSPSVYWP